MKSSAQQNEEKPQLKTSYKAAIVAASALIGGFLGRWHGGGFISGSPKLLKAFLYALPFAALTAYAWTILPGNRELWIIGVITALVLGLQMLLKNTGHGRGMSLKLPMKPGSSPEKLEHLILWLQPKMPVYSYKLLLMTVIGIFRVLPAALAIGYLNPIAGLVILSGAWATPVGYLIGWEVYPDGGEGTGPEDLNEATEIGEFISGIGAYTALTWALMHILTGNIL